MGKMTKRERFLETSLKLINEKGFKATTMRDIAQKLNCEVANIYNYVDSKQSLLETYLFGISNEFHAAIDTIIERIIDIKSREEQITATRALDRILLHSHFAVPLYHKNIFSVAHWNKFLRPNSSPKYDYAFMYGPHLWWENPKKNKP